MANGPRQCASCGSRDCVEEHHLFLRSDGCPDVTVWLCYECQRSCRARRIRDPGLARAIQKAGSMRKLADKLGISQQAISRWRKVPAKRVIAIERTTGVPRERLRPDLHGAMNQRGRRQRDEHM